MTYHPPQSCTRCSGRAQPGTVALMKYTLNRFTFARSMGIYNCRNVAGTSSLSKHACGRALDVGIPTLAGGAANKPLGFQVVEFYDDYSGPLGINMQIYARVLYDARTPDGRYYGGVHPHNDHDHVEQRLEYATSLTYADIVSIAGPPEEGDDMWLYGLDIGQLDAPSVSDPRVGTLQAFLVGQGYNLGTWGPNGDGVDGAAGNDTRKALNKWKTDNGITATKSAGYGRIGDYEAAALIAAGGGATEPPDLSGYVTDADLADHAANPDAHHA